MLIIQVLTTILVLLSLTLIVTVPAALAIPGQWETFRPNLYKSMTLWSLLIFLIGFAASYIK